MVNKRLLALSMLFLLLTVVSHAYIKVHPQLSSPNGCALKELINDAQMKNDQKIRYNIDGEHSNDTILSLNGWAFVEGRNTSYTNVIIGVQDQFGNVRAFQTEKEVRNDVATAFENSMYDNSGFSSVCDMNEFDTGEYELILYVVDPQNDVYYNKKLQENIEFDGSTITIKTDGEEKD